ncbi:MAG: glycoside hydrolase 100 family protein, partial [bacterium]|nr:glycoside hydrolase 100 family protein [bacterium]
GGKKFKEAFEKSLWVLSENQSELGQIPNAIGDYNKDRKSRVTFNTIDSTLWYLIGQYVFAEAFKDRSLLGKNRNNIERAFLWLKYQDPNEDGFLAQHPTMDWQDAFPHKYGRTINTHALYYAALKMFGKNKKAERVKKVINGDAEKYLSLYDEKLGYYLPWAWKNHDGDREQEEWFDALGNLLAIVFGLAKRKMAEDILKYIENKKINRPYPCKAIYPPIKKGDKEWHSYFSKCLAKNPHQYLNAGAWPFIGGFYIAALVKVGDFKKAEKELNNLALANKQGRESEYEFNEWLDGLNGEPKGNPFQAWSAGMYLYAAECVNQKQVLFFS